MSRCNFRNIVRCVTLVLVLFWNPFASALDVAISGTRFFAGGNEIPVGCFAQLKTELNGDNSVASIYIGRPTLRGCMDANYPYPGGDESQVSIQTVSQLGSNLYGIKICERVDGSMGSYCDEILIRFSEREYRVGVKTFKVLTLDKLGDWTE